MGGKKKKIKTPVKYRHFQQKIVDLNVTGNQVIADINSIGLTSQFTKSTPSNASVNAVNDNDFYCGLFSMNPDQYNSGGQLATGESGILQNDRLFVKDVQGTYRVTNFGNTLVDTKIYWVAVKRDVEDLVSAPGGLPDHILTSITDMLTQDRLNQSNTTPTARTLTTGPAAGFAVAEAPGWTPWANDKFRRKYRMLKKVGFSISGGETKTLPFRIEYNKMLNRADMVGGFGQGICEVTKAWTVHCFAIMKGQPVIVPLTTPASTEVITAGPFKLGFEINYSVDIAFLPSTKVSKKSIEYNNYNYANVAATNVKFINEEADTEANYEDAGAL